MPTILVFRIGQLGDTLVSMPSIKEIRDQFPEHSLVLITDRKQENSSYVSSWSLLKPTGWFDDVIFYEPNKTLKGKIFNLFKVSAHIRKLNPDRVFLLTPDRSLYQTVRDRIFFRWFCGNSVIHSSPFSRKPQKRADGSLPRVEPEWYRILSLVSNEKGSNNFVLPVPNDEREFAIKMLTQKGLVHGTQLIAIAPGSMMACKRWPISRFAFVGEAILERYTDTHLVVLGGKEDAELGNQLCKKWGSRGHNFAGSLSLYGSAAVLSQCKLFVGNDTGTMHLAAMVGTKCVALFSARDYPGKWEPYGDGHIILRHRTSCEGCMLTNCVEQNMKCMMSISTEDVLSESSKLLNELLSLERLETDSTYPRD